MPQKSFSQFLAIIVFSVFMLGFSGQALSSEPIQDAVANQNRLEGDFARDINRKPAEILKFFGAEAGMTVLDIFSGGGYYTELLNHIVGAEGSVIAHNNEAYKAFASEELPLRYANNRLTNTEQYWAEANEVQLPENSVDLVLLVLGFHDIYYMPEDNSWPTIDEDKFINAIINSMKPGGILGVVDHRAAAGTPPTSGNTTHRIDPAIVIQKLTEHGLVLADESNILANEDDDLSKPMFDPSVRGKTDRFVLKFIKPTGD